MNAQQPATYAVRLLGDPEDVAAALAAVADAIVRCDGADAFDAVNQLATLDPTLSAAVIDYLMFAGLLEEAATEPERGVQ